MKSNSIFIVAVSLLSMAALLITGCESPVKVESEVDPDADLASYQDYALLPLPKSIPGADPGAALRIRNILGDSVTQTMADKGYEQVSLAEADFAVNITGKVVPKVDVTDWGYSYAPRSRWGSRYPYYGTSNVTVDEYEEGSLILEVYDTQSRELVWVGWGTSRVKDTEPDPERALSVVKDIMASFPNKLGSAAAAEAMAESEK